VISERKGKKKSRSVQNVGPGCDREPVRMKSDYSAKTYLRKHEGVFLTKQGGGEKKNQRKRNPERPRKTGEWGPRPSYEVAILQKETPFIERGPERGQTRLGTLDDRRVWVFAVGQGTGGGGGGTHE